MTEPDNTQKITYHLEMAQRKDLQPATRAHTDYELKRVEIPSPEYNWFLHQVVGVEFRWGGREGWGLKEWTAYVDRPELETWVAYVSGSPAGYFELEKQTDGSVQIECFGLVRQFFGHGLGGSLLTRAVARAWEIGANRVWLNTCTHDHPHALHNYYARGFKLVSERSGPVKPPPVSGIFGPRD